MGRPYVIPPDFETEELDAHGLEAFGALLEYRNSLPAVAEDVDLDDMGPDQIGTLARVLKALQIHEARRSCAAFVEYALTNEQNGDDLRNGDHHNEWHEFLDENDRAILFAPVEHAKTTHIGVGRTLFKLGEDPNRRLAIISNAAEPAEKVLRSVREHIERNPRVHEVFPNLKRSERSGDPWHSSAIIVKRDVISRDPSVKAFGIGGPIVGSRLDGVILDDVLDFDNTRTIEQMKKLVEWCDTTLLTRLTAGAFIHVIGTPWNIMDLLHVLEQRPGFASRRYSAVSNPTDPMDRWIPLWPAQFPQERLREIYNNTTPHNFARKYLCQVQSSETARFQKAWIDSAVHAGRFFRRFPLAPLQDGNGRPLPTFTGVDLAVGKTAKSDLTVMFTMAIDPGGRRIPLAIETGRWQAPEIIDRLHATYQRYGSTIVVEDNAAQSFLLQWAQNSGVPARPFTTGKNKFDERFGVESLAVEMRNGLWVIPSGYEGGLHPELQAWIQEMLLYDPNSHTGDRLMACWFAREVARSMGIGLVRSMDTMSR